MPPTPPLSSTPYQLSDHHRFELYPGNIVETGAAVLLSSTGPSARLTNKISKAIIAASGEQGGEEIRAQVQRLKPIAEGSIAITTAGSISGTRYIFHTVPTRAEIARYADVQLIDKIIRRCIHLADLLELPSVAIPPLGSGRGRRRKDEVVRTILAAAVDVLQECQSVKSIIFATTNPQTYRHYHDHIVVQLMLAQRAQAIAALLPELPPALYGVVGKLLQQMDRLQEQAAQQIGKDEVIVRTETLRAEADALTRAARELGQALPANVDTSAVQLVIATGDAVVKNVTFGVIAQQGSVAARDIAVGRDVYGGVRTK